MDRGSLARFLHILIFTVFYNSLAWPGLWVSYQSAVPHCAVWIDFIFMFFLGVSPCQVKADRHRDLYFFRTKHQELWIMAIEDACREVPSPLLNYLSLRIKKTIKGHDYLQIQISSSCHSCYKASQRITLFLHQLMFCERNENVAADGTVVAMASRHGSTRLRAIIERGPRRERESQRRKWSRISNPRSCNEKQTDKI